MTKFVLLGLMVAAIGFSLIGCSSGTDTAAKPAEVPKPGQAINAAAGQGSKPNAQAGMMSSAAPHLNTMAKTPDQITGSKSK